MPLDPDANRNYARALAVRHRVRAFGTDLAEQPTWKLAAGIFQGRFDLAFSFFLDAPTSVRLAKVVAFEMEMVEIAARLPDPARNRPAGPPD